jgi:hypothetical protein
MDVDLQLDLLTIPISKSGEAHHIEINSVAPKAFETLRSIVSSARSERNSNSGDWSAVIVHTF